MNIPPLTEEVVAQQVAKIRAADVARKVDVVQFFSLQMEATFELPPTAVDAITLLIPTLLTSHSHLLYQSTLTSLLPTYLHLIPSTPADKLRAAVHQIMPPLLEKLNDAKERVHKPAESCLIDLGNAVFRKPSSSTINTNLSSSTGSVSTGKGKEKETSVQMYERILVSAFEAKGSRSKVGGMRVLCGVRQQTRGLGLKMFLPLLVAMLEDGDGSVREEAKSTIIDLLSPSDIPASARSEVQKLMQSRSLKPSLVDGIMTGILAGPQMRQEGEGGNSTVGKTVTGGAESDVPPVLIVTERDLEKEFMAILPPFEGKETEHNWQPREAGIMRVRGMIQSGVHKQFPATFLACLRQDFWQESIKGVMTLRTTLSMSTSALYAETAQAFGESFDPLMDTLLPHLTKLSGSTKKMVAEASQKTVTTFINHATCHPRIFLPFLAAGLNERTVQSRQYFMEHTRHYLATHAQRSSSTKNAIEHAITTIGPGLQVVTDMLKRGLQDANPLVKETARATFVIFHNEWPKHALTLMSGLDDGVRKQLEKAIQAAAASAATTSNAENALGQGTGNEVTAAPVVAAPIAPSGTRRPGTGAARKPSSAIAAAIRKAKEEARARHLAEAEAEAATHAAAALGEEEQNGVANENKEVSQPTEAKDAPSEVIVDKAISKPDFEERTSPVPDEPPAITSNPSSPSLASAASHIPTTPVKPISLLDFNTPDGTVPPFKVMTPLKPVLLESTGINLLDPTHFPSPTPAPSFTPASPRLTLQENGKSPVVADEAKLPNPDISVRAVDLGSRSRKPRVSVNPVKEMDKPAPLFKQLRTSVDCSFWLDRRQGQSRRASITKELYVTNPRFGPVIEYEQTHSLAGVPERLTKLNACPSDLTQDDLMTMIAWSTSHSRCETDPDGTESCDSDDSIRRRVQRAFRNRREPTDEEIGLGVQVRNTLEILENSLGNGTEELLLKHILFLLWNLVIHQPQHMKQQAEFRIIRACFVLRRQSESLSIRRGTAGLLALVVEASQEPVRIVETILACAPETFERVEDQSQGPSLDSRSKAEVFALVHIASVVLGLSSKTVVEEVVPRVKALLLTAINSKSIASREAAYTTILAIHSVVQDESVLFGDLFPELGAAQRKLVMVMIRRDLPATNEQHEGDS
ncbi:hypothetical protein QFC24_000759 [Naganishia onofrii]|uniref:Uncharacterized protein n=1 Tax=Naganishia onofrii TaxID=1851511 RepID=A0ACC2XX65_9TREE|nr:hypothetical protein QFC24_000759 [Naganishia onofrii]